MLKSRSWGVEKLGPGAAVGQSAASRPGLDSRMYIEPLSLGIAPGKMGDLPNFFCERGFFSPAGDTDWFNLADHDGRACERVLPTLSHMACGVWCGSLDRSD